MVRTYVAVVAAACVLAVAAVTPVVAEESESEGGKFAKDFGLGVGSVGANLLYMPVKLVYGVLGGVTGGMAYGLTGGNKQIADQVWKPSMGGTYVVTPRHLEGETPICFSGTSDCGSAVGGSSSSSAGSSSDVDKAW